MRSRVAPLDSLVSPIRQAEARGLSHLSAMYHHGPTRISNHYVYRSYDSEGVLLYIGSTSSVERRIYAHKKAHGGSKASRWLSVCMDRYEVEGPFAGRDEGRRVEAEAIRSEQPLFNIQGKGHGAWNGLGNIAAYLISKGHIDLALETACQCWSSEDLAELGEEFSPWCVVHKHLSGASA